MRGCAALWVALWLGCVSTGGTRPGDPASSPAPGDPAGVPASGDDRYAQARPIDMPEVDVDQHCRDDCGQGISFRFPDGSCRCRPAPAERSILACPEGKQCPELTSTQCRSDDDCTKGRFDPGGQCHTTPDSRCPTGPAPRPPQTLCHYDQCANDDDCGPSGICLARGLGATMRVCANGPCRDNAGCDRRPGGRCELVFDTCFMPAAYWCGFDSKCRAALVATVCQYANDPCQGHTGCQPGETCVPKGDGHGMVCNPAGPPPV